MGCGIVEAAAEVDEARGVVTFGGIAPGIEVGGGEAGKGCVGIGFDSVAMGVEEMGNVTVEVVQGDVGLGV